MRVMVIDDDKVQLCLAEAALLAGGVSDIELYSDAAAAIGGLHLSDAPYDALLLDIMMPAIDGIEACGSIRALSWCKDIPILMMTAMSDREHITAAFVAGATDYIVKPFDALDLSMRLERLVGCARGTSGCNSKDGLYRGAAIDLGDVEGMLDHRSVEAYMEALHRSRATLLAATAFRIEGWPPGSSPPADAIRQVAGSLSRRLTHTKYLLAHFGEGIFVAITRRGDPAVSHSLTRGIAVSADAPTATVRLVRSDVGDPSDPVTFIRHALRRARETVDGKPLVGTRKETVCVDLFAL